MWDIAKGPGYSDQARKRIRVGTNFYRWRYDRRADCDATVVSVVSPLMQLLPSSLCHAAIVSWCLRYNEFSLIYDGCKNLISCKELLVDCRRKVFRVSFENCRRRVCEFPLVVKPALKESQPKSVVDLNAIVAYIGEVTSQLSNVARMVLDVIVSHRPHNSFQLTIFQVIQKSLGSMSWMCVKKMLEYDLGMDLQPLETDVKLLPQPVIRYETEIVKNNDIWDIQYSRFMSAGTSDRHFFVCLTECEDAAMNKYSSVFCQASQSVGLLIRTPVSRARHCDNLETKEIFCKAGNRNADLILFVLDRRNGCHPDDENKYRANIEFRITTKYGTKEPSGAGRITLMRKRTSSGFGIGSDAKDCFRNVGPPEKDTAELKIIIITSRRDSAPFTVTECCPIA